MTSVRSFNLCFYWLYSLSEQEQYGKISLSRAFKESSGGIQSADENINKKSYYDV